MVQGDAGQLGEHQTGTSLSYKEKAVGSHPRCQAEACSGHGAGQDTGKGQVPGPQLVLAAPDEVSKLLVVGVVVVLDSEEHGSRDLHQGVVGCLLLLPARVAVVEVVDFVSYLWKGSGHGINDQLKVLTWEEEEQSPWQGWQQGQAAGRAASPLGLPAAGFSDCRALSNSSGCSCSGCPAGEELPQRLQQHSMKEQEEERQKAARTGRHTLILPGRAGKLFPNSPNQKPFTATVLKSRKKSTLLIPGWSFSQKCIISSLWALAGAAQMC